jgi:hypothetical protein
MATRIQKRRDTAANWTAVNPVLAQGEEGIELDTNKEKIGNGTTAWNSLPYKTLGLTPSAIGAATAAQGAKADSAVQPAGLTKAAVGLGNVDNTSDANKPVSTAQAAALAVKADTTAVVAAVAAHEAAADPHPSYLTAAEGNAAYATAAQGTKADSAVQPAGLTKAAVGLGNVDNTSDANKPVSTAQAAALVAHEAATDPHPGYLTAAEGNAAYATAAQGTKADSAVQPAGLTKAAVGLGNVDNTSDANKPVSTAQAAALAVKADTTAVVAAVAAHEAAADPHPSYLTAAEGNAAYATAAQGTKADSAVQPAGLTKAAVGLGNVDNTSDANKPVSTAQAAALVAHEAAADPHPNYLTAAEGNAAYATAAQGALAVTAIQPGNAALSNARTPTAHKSSHAVGGSDALSPADIGAAATNHGHAISDVSGLQTALSGKADLVNGLVPSSQLPGFVQSVAGRTGAVTLAKGDVGLGNVDNTSDLNKPISSATQTELDGKVSTSDARIVNSMRVVSHGATANTARPAGAAAVYWIGTVEPMNAANNDLWIGGL